MSTLDDQLDGNYAKAWRPEPGETLEGRLGDVDEYDAGYGPYPVLTVRKDDGQELAVHCFHTVLRDQMVKLAPRKGDRLAIRYHGKREKQDGDNHYHSYGVAAPDRPTSTAVDWSKYAAAEAPRDVAPPASAPAVQAAAGGGDEDTSDIPFLWHPVTYESAKNHGSRR